MSPAILPARSGDHPAIALFLQSVFPGLSSAEYKSSLEDPFYHPHDRLLAWRDGRIVGHVQVTHRTIQFGPLRLPVAGLAWLAVAPQCRGQGLGRRLLAAAERYMVRSGAALGLLRAPEAAPFAGWGWAVCGRHHFSRAAARAVLAHLLDRGLYALRRARLQVRPYRRWEQPALATIHRRNLAGQYGAVERTDAYWQWLMARQAYDQVYVATADSAAEDLDGAVRQVAGYAITKGEEIVELLTVPGRERAAAELLARACRDAIEHDRSEIVLHAAPSCFLHEALVAAGGRRYQVESHRGQLLMARAIDPLRLLRGLAPLLPRRADEAGLPKPVELGLLVEGRRYQIEVAAEDARVFARRSGRTYLRLGRSDLARLALGQIDLGQVVAQGAVAVSGCAAVQAAAGLFPPLPLWRPPLDDLRA